MPSFSNFDLEQNSAPLTLVDFAPAALFLICFFIQK